MLYEVITIRDQIRLGPPDFYAVNTAVTVTWDHKPPGQPQHFRAACFFIFDFRQTPGFPGPERTRLVFFS